MRPSPRPASCWLDFQPLTSVPRFQYFATVMENDSACLAYKWGCLLKEIQEQSWDGMSGWYHSWVTSSLASYCHAGIHTPQTQTGGCQKLSWKIESEVHLTAKRYWDPCILGVFRKLMENQSCEKTMHGFHFFFWHQNNLFSSVFPELLECTCAYGHAIHRHGIVSGRCPWCLLLNVPTRLWETVLSANMYGELTVWHALSWSSRCTCPTCLWQLSWETLVLTQAPELGWARASCVSSMALSPGTRITPGS